MIVTGFGDSADSGVFINSDCYWTSKHLSSLTLEAEPFYAFVDSDAHPDAYWSIARSKLATPITHDEFLTIVGSAAFDEFSPSQKGRKTLGFFKSKHVTHNGNTNLDCVYAVFEEFSTDDAYDNERHVIFAVGKA